MGEENHPGRGMGAAEDARARVPPALLGRPGTHATGKGCLHLKRLKDVDAVVRQDLIRTAARA